MPRPPALPPSASAARTSRPSPGLSSSCTVPDTAASWFPRPSLGELPRQGKPNGLDPSRAGRGGRVRKTTREGTAVSDTDKAKNKGQELKGKAKEAAGKAVGNERLEAEGKADQAAGNVKQAGEKVKDAGKSLKP